MSGRRLAFALLALCAALAAAPAAHGVCNAADIVAAEAACSVGSGDCRIAKQYPVENGCTLDFGSRTVEFLAGSGLAVGPGAFTLRAAGLRLHGRLEGVGSAMGARGGMISLDVAGAVTIGRSGEIDVRGTRSGGEVFIRSGGSIQIAGTVLARDRNTGQAAGGLIVIEADGDVSTTADAIINAQGGIDSDGGGEIDIVAGGDITLLSDLNATGFDGGFVTVEAAGSVAMRGADASGRGDAGGGGCVDVVAGRGARINGTINANGVGGTFMTGGCGGLVCLDGGLGELRVAAGALITADGAAPDGGGGQVALLSRGSVVVAAPVSALGPSNHETCGGDLCVEAGLDVDLLVTGRLEVSGGDAGGDLDVGAGRNLRLAAPVDAGGRRAGSLGGDITLRAGNKGRGNLTVDSTVSVSSAANCSDENGCGQAGFADVSGCTVMINGAMLASGPDAGENFITARDQLTAFGTLHAARTNNEGRDGANRLVHRADRAPILQTGSIDPPAVLLPVTACPTTGETEPPCLLPCPVCGNNIVEFPETCDQGVIPPASCGGCSAFCKLEDCDDGRFCTGDVCDTAAGCLNEPTPMCREPTATVTGTPPTATATHTLTPSLTPTVSGTPTASGTPMVTGSATASPSVTATAPASPSAPAIATATTTPTPDATRTPPPACPGDCDGSNGVAVNELIIGVNIALGNSPASACPAFDSDGSNSVSINELIAAVRSALNGC